jgi:hypothetical protein
VGAEDDEIGAEVGGEEAWNTVSAAPVARARTIAWSSAATEISEQSKGTRMRRRDRMPRDRARVPPGHGAAISADPGALERAPCAGTQSVRGRVG